VQDPEVTLSIKVLRGSVTSFETKNVVNLFAYVSRIQIPRVFIIFSLLVTTTAKELPDITSESE
tara:strand:+ start:294 stop:485 length:192 start_codon:yes stop_codon:yes gene_type:complete